MNKNRRWWAAVFAVVGCALFFGDLAQFRAAEPKPEWISQSAVVLVDRAEYRLRLRDSDLSLSVARRHEGNDFTRPVSIRFASGAATGRIVDVEATRHASDAMIFVVVVETDDGYDYCVGFIPRVKEAAKDDPLEVRVIHAVSSDTQLSVLAMSGRDRALGITMLLGDLNIEKWSDGEDGVENLVLYTNSSFTCPPLVESVGHVQRLQKRP